VSQAKHPSRLKAIERKAEGQWRESPDSACHELSDIRDKEGGGAQIDVSSAQTALGDAHGSLADALHNYSAAGEFDQGEQSDHAPQLIPCAPSS
jgi:hypothetical protein